MIYNKNKSIIINIDLWKNVCKKGEENECLILYIVDWAHISFQLNDNIRLTFNNYNRDNNILD